MGEERKVLLEKRKEIADSKIIGGSELLKENGVNVQKEVLNFCVCGHLIEDGKIMICQEEKEKICTGCAILHDRKYFCIDCFQKKSPLTKRQHKVQLCIANEISSKGMIRGLTKIPKKQVKEALEELRKLEYVEKRWFSYRITDIGMDVNSAYSCVWDKDEDIFILKQEIRGFLGIR